MSLQTSPILSIRQRGTNPNHHLWNNNGTWFVHYTLHPTPLTKKRVRQSLNTRSRDEARGLRDNLFHVMKQTLRSEIKACA